MSDIDPTLYPPVWGRDRYDDEQHKVSTESGLLDFFGNLARTVEEDFREAIDNAELPESVRKIREQLDARPHIVHTQDIGNPADWEPVQVAVNTPQEVINGSGIFYGFNAPGTVCVVSFYDAVSGTYESMSSNIPLYTMPITAAGFSTSLAKGVKFRRGLWVASTAAINLAVYHAPLPDA